MVPKYTKMKRLMFILKESLHHLDIMSTSQGQINSDHVGLCGSQTGHQHHLEAPRGLDRADLETSPRICIFNKFPGEADAVGLGTAHIKPLILKESVSKPPRPQISENQSPVPFPLFKKQKKTNSSPILHCPRNKILQGAQQWDIPKYWFGKSHLQ